MFCLFNTKGELKTGIVIFKLYEHSVKVGYTTDVLGNILVRGTTVSFELAKRSPKEIVEIK